MTGNIVIINELLFGISLKRPEYLEKKRNFLNKQLEMFLCILESKIKKSNFRTNRESAAYRKKNRKDCDKNQKSGVTYFVDDAV